MCLSCVRLGSLLWLVQMAAHLTRPLRFFLCTPATGMRTWVYLVFCFVFVFVFTQDVRFITEHDLVGFRTGQWRPTRVGLWFSCHMFRIHSTTGNIFYPTAIRDEPILSYSVTEFTGIKPGENPRTLRCALSSSQGT